MIDVRVNQLARLFGVHRNTVTNWIKKGKFKATPTLGKRYQIDLAEFRNFCTAARIADYKVNTFLTAAQERLGEEIAAHNPLSMQSEVHMSGNPIGSVMVVGGGIAGIQASIDLANAGYLVHLVERSAGIGGAMSQLDKTYPTNDCAM